MGRIMGVRAALVPDIGHRMHVARAGGDVGAYVGDGDAYVVRSVASRSPAHAVLGRASGQDGDTDDRNERDSHDSRLPLRGPAMPYFTMMGGAEMCFRFNPPG